MVSLRVTPPSWNLHKSLTIPLLINPFCISVTSPSTREVTQLFNCPSWHIKNSCCLHSTHCLGLILGALSSSHLWHVYKALRSLAYSYPRGLFAKVITCAVHVSVKIMEFLWLQCKGFVVCPLGEMYEMRRPGYQLPRNSDWPQRLRAVVKKSSFQLCFSA